MYLINSYKEETHTPPRASRTQNGKLGRAHFIFCKPMEKPVRVLVIDASTSQTTFFNNLLRASWRVGASMAAGSGTFDEILHVQTDDPLV